jgi:nitroreductase
MTEQHKLGTQESPRLAPAAEITHPNNPSSVIGHLCEDDRAVLYRTREDHFFRKQQGYAVSQTVINALERVGIGTIFVHERDTETLLEYALTQFNEGTTLAYDTRKDTIIGGLAAQNDDTGRYDIQRVVPEEEATTWEEFTIE